MFHTYNPSHVVFLQSVYSPPRMRTKFIRKFSEIMRLMTELCAFCLITTGTQVWSGKLSLGRTVLLLWNRSGQNATITATWADIGLENGTPVTVRDLWKVQSLLFVLLIIHFPRIIAIVQNEKHFLEGFCHFGYCGLQFLVPFVTTSLKKACLTSIVWTHQFLPYILHLGIFPTSNHQVKYTIVEVLEFLPVRNSNVENFKNIIKKHEQIMWRQMLRIVETYPGSVESVWLKCYNILILILFCDMQHTTISHTLKDSISKKVASHDVKMFILTPTAHFNV